MRIGLEGGQLFKDARPGLGDTTPSGPAALVQASGVLGYVAIGIGVLILLSAFKAARS